jgi:hypothetical protein
MPNAAHLVPIFSEPAVGSGNRITLSRFEEAPSLATQTHLSNKKIAISWPPRLVASLSCKASLQCGEYFLSRVRSVLKLMAFGVDGNQQLAVTGVEIPTPPKMP